MTSIDLGAHFLYPSPPEFGSSRVNLAMTASTHRVAAVVQAPAAGTVGEISFVTGSVTTGCTIEARIETVGADGLPTGTLVAAGATGTVVVDNADDNVIKACTIGTPPTVALGDEVAVVLQVSSGTPNLNMTGMLSPVTHNGWPYHATYNGAAWSKSGNCGPAVWLSIGGTYYGFPGACGGFTTAAARNYQASTNPDEYGNRLQVPFGGRAVGMWWRGQHPNVNQDGVLQFAADDGTLLRSTTLTGQHQGGVGSAAYKVALWTSPYTVVAGTWYRLSLRATGTANIGVTDLTGFVTNSSPIDPATCSKFTRNDNAGAYTDDATSIISAFGLIVDQVDAGGGQVAFGSAG